MSAQQPGDNAVLLYAAQGSQQLGSAALLTYGTPTASRRVVAAINAPWGASQSSATTTHAPHAVTEALDPVRRAPWVQGKPQQSHRRSRWVPSDTQDRSARSPWGQYGARRLIERHNPWGKQRAADHARAMPWGRFEHYLSNLTVQPWALARRNDAQSTAPWGQYARRPVVLVLAPWGTARKADEHWYLPWLKYSKTLQPGWAVVVPDGTPPVDENGTVIVPIRRVYVTVNNLTLVRVGGAVPIPAYTFGMSLDVDSWTWSWQATLHAEALALITPDSNGEPVDLLATINGQPFRLCAESYSRQRQFGSSRINVRGRGRAAILDAPYAPTLNHGNASTRTAQQLMDDVLMINSVPIGWDVAWGLTDWLVPGGVWSHQGSYISAALDIADAAGGYLQPHDTDATLRVLPRYPAAPWQWAALTPDYELPSAVVQVEGIEWTTKPAYNRVHISGTNASGVLGEVTRAGTAGDIVAPMVTHPLITHADAARQRGIAALGDSGRQAAVSLRLPVLEETGVIKPGAMVRYIDGGITRLGLVRSTQVEWAAPTLRQVLDLETHTE